MNKNSCILVSEWLDIVYRLFTLNSGIFQLPTIKMRISTSFTTITFNFIYSSYLLRFSLKMIDIMTLLMTFGPLAFGVLGFLFKPVAFLVKHMLNHSRGSTQPSYGYYDPYYYTHPTTTYLY